MQSQNAATSHNTEPIATSKCGHVTTGLCAAVETLELGHKYFGEVHHNLEHLLNHGLLSDDYLYYDDPLTSAYWTNWSMVNRLG